MTLDGLLARIDELRGEDVYPVVPLELFFTGNEDPASFAPNLEPHPGPAQIAAVLRSIAEQPSVSAVLVQIDEVLEPPDWPYAPAVYVVTSSAADEVHGWAASIHPDRPSPDPADNYGWLEYAGRDRSTPPPGAPDIPAEYRPVILFWD